MSKKKKISDLKPAKYNPRKMSTAKLDALKKSMKKFGDLSGIVFNIQTGNLIGGHQRVKVINSKCKIIDGKIKTSMGVFSYREVNWPEAKEIAANLAANKISGEFDTKLLGDLFTELDDLPDFDINLTGFEPEEVAELRGFDGPGTGGLTDDDATPMLTKKTKTKRGNIFKLGRHRLMCGDATLKEEVAQLLNGKKADMVFTDPPYGVNVKGGKGKGNIIAGDLTQTAIPFSFEIAVMNATKKDARYYFCGGEGNIGLYHKLFERYLAQMPRMLIWVKNGFVMKPNGYHNGYELIFYGFKPGGGGKATWYSGRTEPEASDVWKIKRDPTSEYVHPTQKPVELSERAIKNHTPPDGLIYEPFTGSGSTLIACEKTKRKCYAMELDPHYCDVIVKRWEKYTGEKAKLLS